MSRGPWIDTPLSRITSKIGSGATPRGGKDSYRGDGISLIRSLNVYDFEFDRNNLAHINDAQADQLANVKVQRGDILLNITGASVARCCMVPEDVLPARVNQHVAIIRCDPDKADNRFVYYSINSPGYKHHLLTLAQGGATREALTKQTIEQFQVSLPPLPIQRRISSILAAYDELIENNTRRAAILEEMARRIYEEWFVRFRFPGHEGVRMVESELGLVPEGWAPCRLERVCSRMNSGNTPSRSNPDYWDGGTVAWYKTKELWDGYLFESEERITELAVAEKKSRVFEAGTILMAIYGSPTVGRLGITTGRCACNQAALGMLPDPTKVTFWMLYYTLLALRVEFNNKAQGAAQQNISKEKVAEMPFLLPAMETQRRFDEVVGPMQGMLRNLQERNRNLRTTRDILLPKLISGELSVENIEIAREAP
ncbi:MAG: restriction endonuclease subunit S [Immundisolibacter sp.]|uniref:restriction endonuclease subunit S n=1 Tax=Immundisolibacter sp. TaxID=1934948 RepID=UPI0019A0BDD5|nr:restriction endonuclease subunit S [Immundisolibacter sp.]MBC7160797.1 restriction endonuclease subunit S [Immundisolibacter sp.]